VRRVQRVIHCVRNTGIQARKGDVGCYMLNASFFPASSIQPLTST
jgi:hypothetical protein